MWYPLKNSLSALIMAAAGLLILLQAADPVQPTPVAEARHAASLAEAASRLAARLPIEDQDARLAVAIALYSASALAQAVDRDAAERSGGGTRRDEARRRVAMPYFSFGANPARTTEPGA